MTIDRYTERGHNFKPQSGLMNEKITKNLNIRSF
jgi:hypothetical protein